MYAAGGSFRRFCFDGIEEDARQDEQSAQDGLRGQHLMQENDAERAGDQRVECAQQAGRFRRCAALRYGLQREAEAAAHDGEGQDRGPGRRVLRQVGRLEQERGCQAEHADCGDLQDAGGQGVDAAVGQPVRRDDRKRVGKGGSHRQYDADGGAGTSREGQQGDASEADQGGCDSSLLRQAAQQDGLQERHDHDGRVLQERDGAGRRVAQRRQFRRHGQEEQRAHDAAGADLLPRGGKDLFMEQWDQQGEGDQRPERHQVEDVHAGQDDLGKEHAGGTGRNDRRQENFRLSLRKSGLCHDVTLSL